MKLQRRWLMGFRDAWPTCGGAIRCSVFLLLALLLVSKPQDVLARAVRTNPGFAANSVPRNDDGSTSNAVDLGFTVNFFGATFRSAFVNNNGNITFGGPLSEFTPEGLIGSPLRIIAPFWADVDTRAAGSSLVTYGKDIVDGRPAFGANWVNVGYFDSHDDKLNSFQLVLIDRSDIAPGDFDIEFNYDRIEWETGDASGGRGGLGGTSASAGYSNGSRTAEASFEILGSRLPGLFLDSNRNALVRRTLNSDVRGRLAFFVRQGAVGCTYAVLSLDLFFPWEGGDGAVQVAAPGTCAWTAASSAGFLTLTSETNRSGSGNVDFTVAPNRTSSLRSATLTIAGYTLVVTQEAFITLKVTPPALTLSPVGGVFPSRIALQLESLSGEVDWAASTALLNGQGWQLKVTPSSGTVTESQPLTLILELNSGFLPPSPAAATLTVRDTINGPTVVVPITIATGPGESSHLLLSQTSFVFRVPGGGAAPLSQTLHLLNTGTGSLNWAISASALTEAPWLQYSLLAGIATSGPTALSSTVLTANPVGLAPGVYQALVPISAAGTDDQPQLVTVTLQVVPASSAPAGEMSPNGLVFVAQPGGAAPAAQNLLLSNLGPGDLTFQLTPSTVSGGNWLGLSAAAGSAGLQPATVAVAVNAAGLPAGIYRGAITAAFSSGKARTVQVVLVVVPAGGTSLLGANLCSPRGMDLVTTAVGADANLDVSFPASLQARVVDSCGRAVNDATVLVLLGETTVITLRPVGNGLYSGTWTPAQAESSLAVSFTALHPSYDSVNRGYTVAVAAAPGAVILPVLATDGVVDAASFTPQLPLAPGAIISLFGSGLAAAEAFAGSVPLPRQLRGVRVRIGEEDAPLFYVGPNQINAQVPVSARPGTVVSIAVNVGGQWSAPQSYRIAAVQPSIFQSDGLAAARDAQSRPITFGNPARIGSALQLFATGLGAVDPAAATGAAAPASSTVRSPVRVRFGGVEVPVSFQGLAPGSVGLYQVNVTLPATVPTGDQVPVVIEQNGIRSNPGATVSLPLRRP